MAFDLKTYFFWVSLVAIVALFASLLVFARMSMSKLEKRIKEDGFPRPCPWDGPGARIFWYAWAIAFPVGRINRAEDPFIDVRLVKSYATREDRVRAIVFMVSQAAFILVLFLFMALDIQSL